MIYFISDTHFNHKNIIEYSDRPYSNLEEMTEAYISNWNDRVTKHDVVYHLGDFALSYGKKHEKLIDDILARLNGQKFLIVGNHDRKEVLNNSRWTHVCDYKRIKVDIGGVNKNIVLFHYPIRSWRGIHRGDWHLHGHSHGSLHDYGGKVLDVGVDAVANHKPISLDEVKILMDNRDIYSEDHHQPDYDETT